MDNLKQKIKKNRPLIKDKSIDTYVSVIRNLAKSMGSKGDSLEFLFKFDKVKEHISECMLTTKKNKLTAIIVALCSTNPSKKKLLEEYNKYLKELGEAYDKQLKLQKKTKTQEKNWITYEQFIKVINNVEDEVETKGILSKRRKKLTKREMDLLQQLVVLKTYKQFPLRNDFATMRVLTKSQYKALPKVEQASNNYLVGNKFHINAFKNKKDESDTHEFPIPPKLHKLIKHWLKFNTSGWFLVKNDGIYPMSSNSLTNQVLEQNIPQAYREENKFFNAPSHKYNSRP
jgi:hypothetical protein